MDNSDGKTHDSSSLWLCKKLPSCHRTLDKRTSAEGILTNTWTLQLCFAMAYRTHRHSHACVPNKRPMLLEVNLLTRYSKSSRTSVACISIRGGVRRWRRQKVQLWEMKTHLNHSLCVTGKIDGKKTNSMMHPGIKKKKNRLEIWHCDKTLDWCTFSVKQRCWYFKQ